MSDIIVQQVEEFYKSFSADKEMQAKFIDNPEAFLKDSALPRAYADEILKNMQETQSMSEAAKASGSEVVLKGIRPSDSILTGPQKGTPKISFEATTGLFSIVTGYWLVLNNQATDDISDGLLIGASLAAMICAADPELLSKSAAGVIGGALVIEASVMKLVNRGRGVSFYMNPLTFGIVATLAPPIFAVQLIPVPN